MCSGNAQGNLKIGSRRVVAPAHLLYAVGILFHQPGCVGTGHSVDFDAVQPAHETENIVPEDRVAALGHLVVHSPYVPRVEHQNVVSLVPFSERGLHLHLLRSLCSCFIFLNAVPEFEKIDFPLSDSRIERPQRLMLVLFHQRGQHIVGQVNLPVLHFPVQEFLALIGFGKLHFRKFLLDFGLSLGTHHYVEPVCRWLLVLAGEYLHNVSGVEFLPDGHCLAVHFSARALYAQIGMYVEGEVQNCGSRSQLA